MTAVESFPPGAPCWVDLTSPTPEKVHEFYRALFGWTVEENPEDGPGFAMFTLGGLPVAGLGPCPPDRTASWNVYLNTPDLDATLIDVDQFGGRVLVGPVEVGTAGRGGACVDPTGGVFSVWEPALHTGARLKDLPGTCCWTELLTPHVETAAQFYADVFDWVIDLDVVDGVEMAVAAIEDEAVAGIVTPPPAAGIGAIWSVSFSVADAAQAAAAAMALGGSVAVPPTDIPGIGRYALIVGPTGEAFAIVEHDADDPDDDA